MKIRIGDKVRFLNEVGEGVVSRIKDKNTVFVELNDGFEIPFAANQLVPIHTELILDKDAENIELDPEAQMNDALYLVIEPDHELPQLMNDYRIYLFNASSYHILYTYSIKDEAHFQTIKHGEAGAYQKVLLKIIKPDFFKEYPYHHLDCIFYKNSHYKLQTPLSESVHISQQVLLQKEKIHHEEFDRPVFAFLLKDSFYTVQTVEQDLSPGDIEKLRSIKESGSLQRTSQSSKAYLKSLEKEVDLHIEELVDSISGLSKHDMLSIQMKRFEQELDKAIAAHAKKIIFIHGVGNGRLKQEIVAALRKMKGLRFHDASYKEYGYGATEVIIS